MLDAQFLQQLGHRLLGARLAALAQLDHGHDVLFHGHAAEDGGFLRQIAQAHARALVHGLLGDVLIVQPDRAAVGGDQAGDHVEAGGLARPVRAQQARDLAARQAQRHALHHRTLAEGLADVVDDKTFAGQARQRLFGLGQPRAVLQRLGRSAPDRQALVVDDLQRVGGDVHRRVRALAQLRGGRARAQHHRDCDQRRQLRHFKPAHAHEAHLGSPVRKSSAKRSSPQALLRIDTSAHPALEDQALALVVHAIGLRRDFAKRRGAGDQPLALQFARRGVEDRTGGVEGHVAAAHLHAAVQDHVAGHHDVAVVQGVDGAVALHALVRGDEVDAAAGLDAVQVAIGRKAPDGVGPQAVAALRHLGPAAKREAVGRVFAAVGAVLDRLAAGVGAGGWRSGLPKRRAASGRSAGRRLRSSAWTWTVSSVGSGGIDRPGYLVFALAVEDDPLALIIDRIRRSIDASKGIDRPGYLVFALAVEDDPLALIIDRIRRSIDASKGAATLHPLVAGDDAGVGVHHRFGRGQLPARAAIGNLHVRADDDLALGFQIGPAVGAQFRRLARAQVQPQQRADQAEMAACRIAHRPLGPDNEGASLRVLAVEHRIIQADLAAFAGLALDPRHDGAEHGPGRERPRRRSPAAPGSVRPRPSPSSAAPWTCRPRPVRATRPSGRGGRYRYAPAWRRSWCSRPAASRRPGAARTCRCRTGRSGRSSAPWDRSAAASGWGSHRPGGSSARRGRFRRPTTAAPRIADRGGSAGPSSRNRSPPRGPGPGRRAGRLRQPDHHPRIGDGAARLAEGAAGFARIEEAGLLQHPARGGVVGEVAGDQGATLPALGGPDQGPFQGLGGEASAPEVATDPVARLGHLILVLEQADDANRSQVLVLDDEGVGLLGILGRDVQDEVLGVLHLEGVGHPHGHPRDVAVVGHGRDAADVLGARRTQDETPGFDDGRSFNHAHGSRPFGATAVLVHQGSGEQRDPDLVQFALLGGHSLSIVVGRGENRHVTTATTFGGEFHSAGRGGEQRVVAAKADVFTGVEGGAALTHEDVAGQNLLAAVLLHAKALGMGVATVTRRTTGFLVDRAVPLGLLAGAFDAGDAQDRFHLAMAVRAAIALTTDLLEDLDLLALAGLDQRGCDSGAVDQRSADRSGHVLSRSRRAGAAVASGRRLRRGLPARGPADPLAAVRPGRTGAALERGAGNDDRGDGRIGPYRIHGPGGIADRGGGPGVEPLGRGPAAASVGGPAVPVRRLLSGQGVVEAYGDGGRTGDGRGRGGRACRLRPGGLSGAGADDGGDAGRSASAYLSVLGDRRLLGSGPSDAGVCGGDGDGAGGAGQRPAADLRLRRHRLRGGASSGRARAGGLGHDHRRGGDRLHHQSGHGPDVHEGPAQGPERARRLSAHDGRRRGLAGRGHRRRRYSVHRLGHDRRDRQPDHRRRHYDRDLGAAEGFGESGAGRRAQRPRRGRDPQRASGPAGGDGGA
uniref:GGDEF domain-containing protein n=1 Tax=Parastrongyloides trichosuri TaxID=131310 RepID=A0A0N4ZIQ5_PARTI